jgi:hypothetical protein
VIFRRSFSDCFRRDMQGACHGIDILGANNARMQADQAGYMAQVARNNQQVAQWNAQRALQQGQVQEDQQRQKTAQAIGTQRANLASQGGDIGSGSNVDLIGDTARAGAFDALTIRGNAQANAYKYLLDANAEAGQESLYSTRASNIWSSYGNSLLGKTLTDVGSVLATRV